MRTKTDEEKELSQQLSSCMLGHWKFCAGGMLMSLPISIHRKSYWPVTFAAVAGTAADFIDGSKNCQPQKDALAAYMARLEAAETAETKKQMEGALATAPQDGWPQEQPALNGNGWDERANGSSDGQGGEREGEDKW